MQNVMVQRVHKSQRRLDHLVWLVPMLLGAGLLPFFLGRSWVSVPVIDLIAEVSAVLAAFGVALAALLRYHLRRTRLSLLLALSFLAAGLLDAIHSIREVLEYGYGSTNFVTLAEAWTIERTSLAVLLLLGLALNQVVPIARRTLVEGVLATIAVLAIGGFTALVTLLTEPSMYTLHVAGFPHGEQISIAVLFVVALPLYFHVYQRERDYLWGALVVAIVINIFAQILAADSSAELDAPYIGSHIFKLVAYLAVLVGFALSGTQSARKVLLTARRHELVLRVAEVSVQSGVDIEVVSQQIAAAIVHALQLTRVSILLRGDDQDTIDVIGGFDARGKYTPMVPGNELMDAMPNLPLTLADGVVRHTPLDNKHVLDSRVLKALQEVNAASLTIVPLLVQGRSIGVLSLSFSDATRVLSNAEVRLASAIASQVAMALEVRRLLAVSNEQTRQQAMLYESTASLNAGLEPQEILGEVAEQLRVALDATGCSISNWDRQRGMVVIRTEGFRSGGADKPTDEGNVYSPSDFPLMRQVLESQEPTAVYLEDEGVDPAERALMEEFGQQSLLMLPLVSEGTAIGLVKLFDSRVRRFEADQIGLAQALAQHAAAAMQRARLYELERVRSAQLSLLNWLSSAFEQPVPDAPGIEGFVRRLSLAWPQARSILVYQIEPGSETLRLKGHFGISPETAKHTFVRGVLRHTIETFFSPESPVYFISGADNPYREFGQAMSVAESDGMVGLTIYVRGDPILFVAMIFSATSFLNERDTDFLHTLSATFGNILTSRQLFESIETERERLRTTLASTADAVILVSPEAEIVLINSAASGLLGVDEQQAVGQPLSDILSGSAFQAIVEHIHQRKVEPLARADIRLDDRQALLASVTPVLAAESRQLGYVIDMVDVTELQDLSELKTQMLRMASHDLLNPLSQARLGFEMLMDDLLPIDDTVDMELVSSVREGLERMNLLIDTILNVERLEAGALERLERVSVETLLQGVMDELASMAKSREQTLEVDIAADVPQVEVDITAFSRALHNLVENAIKYTLQGGLIQVQVTKDKSNVVFKITDTGVGIPLDEQAHIFDPFYRAHQPGTEDAVGSGLGLSLVRSAVTRNNGTLELNSVPGEGTTFIVSVPAANNNASE